MHQRILSGRYGGRFIRCVSDKQTRSMSMRARTVVFDILCHHEAFGGLAEKHVLDGFCGSGALGLEALSRGCRMASFIDWRHKALATTSSNIHALGVQACSFVLRRDMTRLGVRVDVLPAHLFLLTPPWRVSKRLPNGRKMAGSSLAIQALASMQQGGWLMPQACGIIETDKRDTELVLDDALWQRLMVRFCGDHQLTCIRYQG